jgi:uncharacterized protein YycO
MTVIGPGRYICLKTPGILGWVIRQATHSQFNHVVLAGPDGKIVEATPAGVRETILSRYRNHQACANLDELMTPAQGLEAWDAALKMVGEPYNFPALLEIGLGDLGWHWRLLIRLAGADRAFICSQLVALAGKAAMPPLDWMCHDTNADQVTPASLARRPGVVPVSL